jgi:hypothetical protein
LDLQNRQEAADAVDKHLAAVVAAVDSHLQVVDIQQEAIAVAGAGETLDNHLVAAVANSAIGMIAAVETAGTVAVAEVAVLVVADTYCAAVVHYIPPFHPAAVDTQ